MTRATWNGTTIAESDDTVVVEGRPVHEKETITVVSAIKKAPIIPPLSAFASALFTKLPGKTNSKAPKKDIAKTRNNRKKSRFGIQCVLKILPALGPKMPNEKSAPNKVKIITIEKPKKMPFLIDFPRLLLPCIKNETVIGIIGNTQGVKIAAKPASTEIKINTHSICPPEEDGVVDFIVLFIFPSSVS